MNHTQKFLLHLPGSDCQPRDSGRKLSCPCGDIKSFFKCSAKAMLFLGETMSACLLLATGAQDTTKLESVKLHCATLTKRLPASPRSTNTRLFEKHRGYLGRSFESCQERRLLGSWEPEAAGHTEHSRLPTLLHWHQLRLYLNKTSQGITQSLRVKLLLYLQRMTRSCFYDAANVLMRQLLLHLADASLLSDLQRLVD